MAVRRSSQTQLEVRGSVFSPVPSLRACHMPGLILPCVFVTSPASIFISTGAGREQRQACLLLEAQEETGNWERFQLRRHPLGCLGFTGSKEKEPGAEGGCPSRPHSPLFKLCPSCCPLCEPACSAGDPAGSISGWEDPSEKRETSKTVWLDIQDTKQTVRFKEACLGSGVKFS